MTHHHAPTQALRLAALAASALCAMPALTRTALAAGNVVALCSFEQGPRGWKYYDRNWNRSEVPRSCALRASSDAKSGRLAGQFIFQPSQSWAAAELRLASLDRTLFALMEDGYSTLRFALKGDGTEGCQVRVEIACPGVRAKQTLGSFGLADTAWRYVDFSLDALKGNKAADNPRVSIVFTLPKSHRGCRFLLDDLCLVRDPQSSAAMSELAQIEPDGRFPQAFLKALRTIDSPPPPAAVVDVGARRQLFVDDFVVDTATDLAHTFHPAKKHPQNPLIYPDKAKAGSFLYLYGSVLHDAASGIFKMWYYQAEYRSGRSGTRYATSNDGLRWTTHDAYIPFITMGIVREPRAADPGRRYKSLSCTGGWPKNEYGVFFSSDGIQWKPYEHNPVLRVMASDVNPTIHDPDSGFYVSFVKVPVNSQRTVGISFSRDFLAWTDPISIFVPDDEDRRAIAGKIAAAKERGVISADNPAQYTAEVYGLGCMPYHGLYLGIPWMFYRSGVTATGGCDGVIEPQLMATRDLLTWQRVGDRQPLIPLGAKGEWDSGMIVTTNQPIVVGDEIWIYYGGFNVGHADQVFDKKALASPAKRAGIGLATLRLDGFVSLDAGDKLASLLTKPMRFTGKTLLVNADASHGELRVEALDERSQPIEPFTAAKCRPLCSNRVNQQVRWQGGDLGRLVGQPVRLRFSLRNASMYAFQFK